MSRSSLDRGYFDRLYERDADPWAFETSAYERQKYDATIEALEHRRYPQALEIGCSIGVLTRRLAERCDDLLSVDISRAALDQARTRCADLANVNFEHMAVPAEFPPDPFDLVVVSEVAYYWSDPDFAAARERIAAALRPGGDLLLVHFLPKVPDYVRDGDAVHESFLADGRYERRRSSRTERYRLDLLRRR